MKDAKREEKQVVAASGKEEEGEEEEEEEETNRAVRASVKDCNDSATHRNITVYVFPV